MLTPKPRRPATMSAADLKAQRGRDASASPRAKKPASPANLLTQAIIALLTLKGFRAWRQNNAAVYDPTRQVFRSNSATPGISDILGYHRRSGLFCAVEVKVGADRLSKEQIAFLSGIRLAGGFACEGRSLAQVETELNAYLLTLTT